MPKLRLIALISLLGLSACSTAGPPTDRPVDALLALEGAKVWDGTGAEAISDAVVVVRGDRIEGVGPRGTTPIPEGATLVSVRGKTIIPGLINCHGHVGMTRGLKASRENYGRENILVQLRQYARYGVTAVMSLGTDFEAIFEVRGPAGATEEPRATVFTAGRGFTNSNGYPAVLPGNAGVPRELGTVEEVRSHVAELAAQKVDMVKIWVDDHWGHYEKIPAELYRAIIEEAHRQGLRVMAHLFYLEDARDLVRSGLDGMAHSVRDREIDDAMIALLREKKTFAVSTLAREESTFIYAEPPAFLDDPFFSRWIEPDIIRQLKDPAYGQRVKSDPDFSKYPGQLRMAQRNLKRLVDAGIPVAFGSDSGPPGRFHGFFEHRELALMVEAGLTPAQALLSATGNAATALRISEDFGTLARGKRADLIVLDEDPLKSIDNMRTIHNVYIGGRAVF